METNLQQVQVPLKEGLDLFSPRLEAPPGSLLDCRNYEAVDTVGYRRIDGFERFDGTPSNVTSSYYLLTFSGSGGGEQLNGVAVEDAFPPGNRLITGTGILPFGTILSRIRLAVNSWAFTIIAAVPETSGDWPTTSTPSIIDIDDDNSPSLSGLSVTNPITLTRLELDSPLLSNEALGVPTDTLVGYLNSSYDDARGEKTKFPWWSGRAHGLHWFKDHLYAVADCEYVYLVTNGAVTDGALYPGEIFTFGTASFQLLDFQVLEGSLLFADAVVKCLVRRIGSVLLSVEHLTNGGSVRATGNSLKLYSTAVPNLSSGVTDPPVWGAALYRSTSEAQATAENQRTGWNPIDMGLEINFTGGTGTPIAELTREFYEAPVAASTPTTLEASSATASYANGIPNAFSLEPSGGTIGSVLESASDGEYAYITVGSGGPPRPWVGGDDTLDIRGFDMSALPDDCFITGIEVKVVAATRSSSGLNTDPADVVRVPEMYISGFERLSQNRGSLTLNAITGNAGYNTYTWGGDRDLWGIGDLINVNTLRELEVGFRARFIATDTMTVNESLRIDRAFLVVHYVPATSRVFIGDSSNKVAVDVVRVHVRTDDDSGTNWSNAEGVIHVYNITYDAYGTRSWISVGDGIYLTADSASPIATVSGTKGSLLPTLNEISTAGTRYQMITANFYAREDWESIYGASGVGRAFAWDNKFFRKIYTELDATIDTPRHIEYYRNYLALGYRTGNVLLSAITADGPEPENFSATDGALAFNFNDKVFGLRTLPDTTLGVFCENSIHRLVLKPDGDLGQSVISSNSGILEYTLAPLGPTVVFCDRRGIRSLEQVDVYGDFLGRPLSTPLGSWLRNRLTKLNPYSGADSVTYPVVAYSSRSKNQYRLWFRDGMQLTMTLMGPEEAPVFTLQRFTDGSSYYAPIAISNGTDEYGRERIHFAHYAPWASASSSVNTDTDKMYVFEMDRGWRFDDNTITGYIDINYNPLDNPIAESTLKKVRLYGNSYGLGTLTVATRNVYNESFSTSTVPISLPRDVDNGLPTDPRWYTNIANVSERGRHIGLRISHSPASPEPSHTLQGLILDFTTGKMVT